MKFKDLDPVFLNQLRLQILTLVLANKEVDFSFLVEATGATGGNVSTQMKICEDAGYLVMTKTFKNNRPNTSLKMTSKGIKAYDTYVAVLKSYFEMKK